jgi:CxxC-x17-CxxC domain-containing protein
MKDFKKGGFGGGHRSSGGFNKGGFRGAPKRDFSAPPELHQATCARCHKTCEVPFRPNGKKPVLCKDCFASSRPDAPAQGHAHARPSFGSRPTQPFRTESTQPRTENLKPQLDELAGKIDTLMRMVKALEQSLHTAAAPEAAQAPAKKTVKKASKK